MSRPHSTKLHRLRQGFTVAASAVIAMSFVAGASPATAAEGAEADPQLAVYVEVNSNDLANVADYTLADSGAPPSTSR